MNRPSNPKLIGIAKVVCRKLRRRQTAAEQVFWECVRNRRFHSLKFNRQFPLYVEVAGRETFFVADFYCHEKHVVVELDGGYHRARWEEDHDRDDTLAALGIMVIRLRNEEIERDLEHTLNLLAAMLGVRPVAE
jgi:very-short-patch-repair endonuclease